MDWEDTMNTFGVLSNLHIKLPKREIAALTLVITDRNLRHAPNEDIPVSLLLLSTMRDVNEVDRCVYVNSEGEETYIKDRYPAESLRGAIVTEHRIHRPQLLHEHIDVWVEQIRTLRKKLKLTGKV